MHNGWGGQCPMESYKISKALKSMLIFFPFAYLSHYNFLSSIE